MKTTQHTPGEWRVSGDAIINGKGTICVLCKPDKFTGGSKRANGRLIAAAPEMLKVLREIIASVDADNRQEAMLCAYHYHNAEDAIAEAEGKP